MNNPTPSAEIVEKWRAEFHTSFDDLEMLARDQHGFYKEKGVQSMWQGFLMARSTVVIPLPAYQNNLSNATYYLGRNTAIDSCAKAIESQGYKTIRGE